MPKTPRASAEEVAKAALQEQIDGLDQYVLSRLPRVEAENMAGSHLLGIMTQTIRLLEVLMREMLAHYLDTCHLEYGTELKPHFKKTLDELTLGQVVNAFRTLNVKLTQHVSARVPMHKLDRTRSLFPKSLDKKLGEITSTRRSLQHYNVPVLREKTREVLINVHDMLSEPLFRVLLD
jgi:hypothetical protein